VEFEAIFPGAFNPLHDGHRLMAQQAARRLGKTVSFEISIQNVDKPPLDYLEIQQRLGQFTANQTVWLTAAPTFARKSQLFPGATFIVGADTIVRIADPHYYGDDPRERDRAIEQIAAQCCRFLVFARPGSVSFGSLSEVQLPASLLRLCDEVPAEEFRVDVSSTELRKQS
jgi:nicotinic acid mononucleotide adenylyltransferase